MLVVPVEVSTSGYRIRVHGEPLDQLDGVLTERNANLRFPPEVVERPEETIVTVEALRGTDVPPAVWQFLVSDPAGSPS